MRKTFSICIVSLALGMGMAGISRAEDLSPFKSFWCEARIVGIFHINSDIEDNPE